MTPPVIGPGAAADHLRPLASQRLASGSAGASKSLHLAALASATVSAVMLTMRRTVADGVRMCTGLAAPSNTGPIAMPPPAAVFSRLYEMLAASMFGHTRRLASPDSVVSGISSLR